MDMHVRFWNTMENQVCTRYFNSVYMGKARALYILQQFKTCKENLNDENVLQVSTDGLNVIKKFVKKYSAERKNDLSELFSIGTHELHVVSGWKIEKKRKLIAKKDEFS